MARLVWMLHSLTSSSPRKIGRCWRAEARLACNLHFIVTENLAESPLLRRLTGLALVAQGIEHRPPAAGAQVRILPGAHCDVARRRRQMSRDISHSHLSDVPRHQQLGLPRS